MSFTDDDKEALGEDLDELKSSLDAIKNRAISIDKNLGTLVTMAWVLIISSIVASGLMIVAVINGG